MVAQPFDAAVVVVPGQRGLLNFTLLSTGVDLYCSGAFRGQALISKRTPPSMG